MVRKSITRSRIPIPDIIKRIREGERKREVENRKIVMQERRNAKANLRKIFNKLEKKG